MKTTKILAIVILALGLMACQAKVSEAAPLGTAFTYQGRLMDKNKPADGLYDFQFKLYDSNDPCTGTQLASPIDINDLDVIDGHFVVELDFGSGIFDGNAVWLETRVVRSPMGSDPAALSPLLELTPTPYALYAQTAGGDGDWRISVNDMYAIPFGNVGIGTTSPDAKLSIKMPRGAIMRPSTVGGLVIKHNLLNIANQLEVQDALGNTSFVVHNTGNVGIGTTTPGSYKLNVVGAGKGLGAVAFQNENGSSHLTLLDNGGTARMAMRLFSSGTVAGIYGNNNDTWVASNTNGTDPTKAYIYLSNSNGNVGIGKTNPSTKLDVVGTVNATAFVGDGSGLTGIAGDGDWTISGNDMYSAVSGNAGIGTTSPDAKLEVNGDLKVTGAYKGDIGPNNGAPFPRPAYDSGWVSIEQDVGKMIWHNIGGNVSNYVVDMQFKDTSGAGAGINNGGFGGYGSDNKYFGGFWYGLAANAIYVRRYPDDSNLDQVRIRIWVYN